MIELYIENPLLKKGRWFELPIRFEEVQERLSLEEGDEYLITDYMAPFSVRSFENFTFMNEVAEQLEDEQNNPALGYLGELVANGFFSDLLEASEKINEIVVYSECSSYTEYAEHYIEECGYLTGLPDIIAWHIDYEGIGRDLSFEGSLYQADDGIMIDVRP